MLWARKDHVKPGQLGIIRVGSDSRTREQLGDTDRNLNYNKG